MKLKLTLLTLSVPLALLLTGCEVLMSNLTPRELPQNPSGLYALEMEMRANAADVVKESINSYVIIDGARYKMRKSQVRPNHFVYDYKMPKSRNVARYYYEVHYKTESRGVIRDKEENSNIHDLRLINRYVVTMQNDRGLVGSEIPVMGRGFTPYDQITVGGVPAETRFSSPNTISFCVPALKAAELYPVELESGLGTLPIGDFLVDSSPLYVNRSSLSIKEHERTILVFQVDQPAPQSGILLDITTDIPESVVMPEAIIPAGARTVSVVLEGGLAGSGMLFATAPGFEEIKIPVQVGADSNETWL